MVSQLKSQLLAGSYKAVCYSGFMEGQHPDRGSGGIFPPKEQILKDLRILSADNHFPLIRLYDCGQNSLDVLELIEEHQIPIKVLLGIWLFAEKSNHNTCTWLDDPIPKEVLGKNREENQREINRGIDLAKRFPETVAAVNVGNECLVDWNDHGIHVENMISYVKKVKEMIEQPVSVADNYLWWVEEGEKLAEVVDFLAIHTYPQWNDYTVDQAVGQTIKEVEETAEVFPGKTIVITEAGWASHASEFGERADEMQQEKYYKELMEWAEEMNITTFFFEAFDEPWKGDPSNPHGAEKHWGLYFEDRTPKKAMKK